MSKIEDLLKKNVEDLTDEEYEQIENRIIELEKHLEYCNRRDEVCLAIDGEQERYEIETELEELNKFLYEED